jgi:general stress protein YciG
MNAGIIGTQSLPTNDRNPRPQVGDSPSASQSAESAPQELTPDRPPHPVEREGDKPRRPRGFAAMDRTLVSEIARKGGKAAHSAGTAHEFTSEEARVAGRKGGRATHAKRKNAVGDLEGNPEGGSPESGSPESG